MNNYPAVNPIWFKFIIPSSGMSVSGPSFVHRPWLSMSTVSSCDKILSILIGGPKKKNWGGISACPLWCSTVIYLDRLGCTQLQKGACHIIIHSTSSQLGKMPERQIQTCWSARRAERQAGRQTERQLKFVKCSFSASPWIEVTGAEPYSSRFCWFGSLKP